MTSFVKINTDASFQEQARSGGWGAICRDEMSDIRFAVVGPLTMLMDAFHAEALALSNAIDVAEQLGVERVMFETDYINLRNALTSSEYDLGPVGILPSDMKYRLRLNFIDARVTYAPRDCNKPAHKLAAMGVGLALCGQ
ncbi:uncharacterized protein [Lolium perenne]|uniref:uncharacterized protein n=1 Tax=Lolium perenne TaxID=4522 RepID=UPI003A997292